MTNRPGAPSNTRAPCSARAFVFMSRGILDVKGANHRVRPSASWDKRLGSRSASPCFFSLYHSTGYATNPVLGSSPETVMWARTSTLNSGYTRLEGKNTIGCPSSPISGGVTSMYSPCGVLATQWKQAVIQNLLLPIPHSLNPLIATHSGLASMYLCTLRAQL